MLSGAWVWVAVMDGWISEGVCDVIEDFMDFTIFIAFLYYVCDQTQARSS